MHVRHVSDHGQIDCRFPYEYDGGHISGAFNLWTFEKVMAAFFTHPIAPITEAKTFAVIFHCEFSSHRAPTQCKNLRFGDLGPFSGTAYSLLQETSIWS